MTKKQRTMIKQVMAAVGVKDYDVDEGKNHLKARISTKSGRRMVVFPKSASCPRTQQNMVSTTRQVIRDGGGIV